MHVPEGQNDQFTPISPGSNSEIKHVTHSCNDASVLGCFAAGDIDLAQRIMIDFSDAAQWKISPSPIIASPHFPCFSLLVATERYIQLIQINGCKLTPFLQTAFIEHDSLEIALHLLVKRAHQKDYYKG